MHVFEWRADVAEQWVRWRTADGSVLGSHEQTKALLGSGRRLRIVRDIETTPADARLADCSLVNHEPVPCLSGRAMIALRPHLASFGLRLDLECDEGPHSLFEVTRLVDALDEQKSDIVRFPDGRVMRIKRFVFDRSAVEGELAFKLVQCPSRYTFVSERFVDIVLSHALTGFAFTPVWRDPADAIGREEPLGRGG